jgi:hypothetical protein
MSTLRAVQPGEKSIRLSPKSVTEAAADGSTRELLVALRARVATAVQNPDTPARDLAALTRRLQDIVKEIEAIDAREEQEAARHSAATDGAFDASAY